MRALCETLLTRLWCVCAASCGPGTTLLLLTPCRSATPWPGPERCGLGPGHGLSGPSKYWLQVRN